MKQSESQPLSTSEIAELAHSQLSPFSQNQIAALAQLQNMVIKFNQPLKAMQQFTIPMKAFEQFASFYKWNSQVKVSNYFSTIEKQLSVNLKVLNSIPYAELSELYSTFKEETADWSSDYSERVSSEISESVPLETQKELTESSIFNFDFLSELSIEGKLTFLIWLIGLAFSINFAALSHQDAIQAHQDAVQAHQDFLMQQSTSQNNNAITNNQPNKDK